MSDGPDIEGYIEQLKAMDKTMGILAEGLNTLTEVNAECPPEARRDLLPALPALESVCRRNAMWIAAAKKLCEQVREAAGE